MQPLRFNSAVLRGLVSLVFATLLVRPAHAAPQESKLVAVFPLSSQGAIDPVDKSTFDELVRSEAGRHLSAADFLVLTSETQLRVLEDNGLTEEEVARACEQSCSLGVAKELKVRLFVAGSVNRGSDGGWIAFVRLFHGDTGAILASASVEGASARDLRKAFQAEAPSLFRTGLAKLGVTRVEVSSQSVTVPDLSDRLSGSALQLSVDADVLVAYDAALKADKLGPVEPEAAIRAWEALARAPGNNSFREDARSRAREWTRYAEQRAQALAQQRSDREQLVKVLKLGALGRDQKSRMIAAYAAAYGEVDAMALLAFVEPESDRRPLCDEAIGKGRTIATEVGIELEGGGAARGTFDVLADGRAVGRGPGTLSLPYCADKVQLRQPQLEIDLETPVALVSAGTARAQAVVARQVDRRTKGGEATKLDRATGLEWTTAGKQLGFPAARRHCRSNGAGWRLPRVTELKSSSLGSGCWSESSGGAWNTVFVTTSGNEAKARRLDETINRDYRVLEATAHCVRPVLGEESLQPEATDKPAQVFEWGGAWSKPYVGYLEALYRQSGPSRYEGAFTAFVTGFTKEQPYTFDLELRAVGGTTATGFIAGAEAGFLLRGPSWPFFFEENTFSLINLELRGNVRLAWGGSHLGVSLGNLTYLPVGRKALLGLVVQVDHVLVGSNTGDLGSLGGLPRAFLSFGVRLGG